MIWGSSSQTQPQATSISFYREASSHGHPLYPKFHNAIPPLTSASFVSHFRLASSSFSDVLHSFYSSLILCCLLTDHLTRSEVPHFLIIIGAINPNPMKSDSINPPLVLGRNFLQSGHHKAFKWGGKLSLYVIHPLNKSNPNWIEL